MSDSGWEEEQQRQLAEMREKFLKVLKYMENKQLEIETYRGAQVNAQFRSVDYNLTNWHVSNLNTPIGIVPEALLRTSDIVTMKFPFSL